MISADPLRFTAPSLSLAPPAGALRRRLGGDLERLQAQISGAGLPEDKMTMRIREWAGNFRRGLNSHADEEWVRDQYISLLPQMLRDPLYQRQLDETAVLGNDGFTYCLQSLTDYRASVPLSYRERSPLNPQSEIFFDYDPHPVVRTVTAWLREHRPSACAPLPTRQDRLAAIFAREAEIQEERDAEASDFQRLLLRERVARRAELRERVTEFTARTDAHTRVATERIEQIQANHEQQTADLRRAITHLEQQSVDLRRGVDELKRQNQRLNQQLNQTERDTLAVQQQIQEARIEIQEAKAAQMNALLIAVSLAGVCCFTTLALQGTLTSVGSSVQGAVVPMSSGKGAMIMISTSI